MHYAIGEEFSAECIAEIIALEEKWKIELCSRALWDSATRQPEQTSDVNRRLAQLERWAWGCECGPHD